MENENLNTALADLVDAIRNVTLGSVEPHVIKSAGISLIQHWNDNNCHEDWINEETELKNWYELCWGDFKI